MPAPSARPTCVDGAARATASPSWASSVTSAPVISRPSRSLARRAPSPGARAAAAAPARPIALPDATTPGSPRSGHWPWHGGPSSSTTMWPELRGAAGGAADEPAVARRSRRRCPVPTVSITASSQPSAAPWRHSASIAQLPSLSIDDRHAEPLLHQRLEAARPRAAGAGRPRRRRARWSSAPGMPKPTPSTGVGRRVGRLARPSRRARRAARSSRDPASERWARWCTARSASTAPARSFVPPTSTPMTHAPATGGTIPGRWLPTRRRRIPAGVPHTASTARRRAGSRAAAPSLDELRARTPPPAPGPGRDAAPAPARPRRAASAVAPDPHVGGRSRSPAGSRSPLVLFLFSAQFLQDRVDGATKARARRAARRPSSRPRPSSSSAPTSGPTARRSRARSTSGPSRSDSMQLMRVGGGHSAKLSIPRDTIVEIPGHGLNKINAAYAIGGSALAVKTVKQYLGIEINHVILVNFEKFPQLIDAMGGIDYTGGCVVSRINGGFRNGGFTLRLKAGTTHIDGRQALALVADAQERVQPARERPHARAPPAEGHRRDALPGALPLGLHPLAVHRLARAADDHAATWARSGSRACSRRSRRPGTRTPRVLQADGRGDAARRRRGADGLAGVRAPPGGAVPARVGARTAEPDEPAFLAAGFASAFLSFFFSACLSAIFASCLSAPSLADFSSSRLRRLRAVVGVVEALALEVDRDGVEHALDRDARLRVLGQRVVGDRCRTSNVDAVGHGGTRRSAWRSQDSKRPSSRDDAPYHRPCPTTS